MESAPPTILRAPNPDQARSNDLLVEQTRFLAGLAAVLLPLFGGAVVKGDWLKPTQPLEVLLIVQILVGLAGIVVAGFIELALLRRHFSRLASQRLPGYEPVLRLLPRDDASGPLFQWEGTFVRVHLELPVVAHHVQQVFGAIALVLLFTLLGMRL